MSTMASSPSNSTPPGALWQYVSVGDYQLPSDTVEQKIRSGIGALWKKFETEEESREAPLQAEADLRELSRVQTAAVAPDPDWLAAAEALDTRLAPWLADEAPDRPVVFLVVPPHGFREEILEAWAKRHNWQRVDAPDAEAVLAQDRQWMRGAFEGRRPWVFPRLERAFLRHARGLSLVRGLMDGLCAGRLGRGIVGCDSWAWAYLMKIWRGRPPRTLTSQAFGQERLEPWFGTLAAGTGRRRLDFRQSQDGRYVLPRVGEADEGDDAPTGTTRFLKHLAACARGIPGVALALWRASLRLGPENPPEDRDSADDDETDPPTAPHSTIWVAEWDAVRRPALPSERDRDMAFVTHTMLLHDGLAEGVLAETLPLSMSRIHQILSMLEETGAAAEDEGLWRITAPGYPAVRQFLQDEGYLTDPF
jgi:hypothetical protein